MTDPKQTATSRDLHASVESQSLALGAAKEMKRRALEENAAMLTGEGQKLPDPDTDDV